MKRALVVAAGFVAVLVGAANLVVWLGGRGPATHDVAEVPPAEAALVLGAQVHADGRPSIMLADRVRSTGLAPPPALLGGLVLRPRPEDELLRLTRAAVAGCRGSRPGGAVASRPLVVHDGILGACHAWWPHRPMIRPRAKGNLNASPR